MNITQSILAPDRKRIALLLGATLCVTVASGASGATPSVPIDPVEANVPKYVIPLLIMPEMPGGAAGRVCQGDPACPDVHHDIALRQFQQQILPGGVWNAMNGRSDNFAATPVWSYGAAGDPIPRGYTLNGTVIPFGVAPAPADQSSFNYPAYTVENLSQQANSVRWINELVAIDPATGKPYPFLDPRRTALPHLVAIDRTLHFANPERLPCANPSTGAKLPGATDCRPYVDPANPDPRLGISYDGPVPMVVHVHGAEVNPYSDGFPEAWWLPAGYNAKNGNPLSTDYAIRGSHYDQAPGLRTNRYPGSAAFRYENAQPPTTLWFHDHTLGMTANNLYAGPMGFWLIRGDYTTVKGEHLQYGPLVGSLPGSTLRGRPTNPKTVYEDGRRGCDPNFDPMCRARIREIPLAIQDRSFNADGSLFYPTSRAFFDGNQIVPYLPASGSDVSPIHNSEFFGNMIVVNGAVWPTFEVVPQRYRLRMLAAGDSRTFNFSLWAMPPGAQPPNQNSPSYLVDLQTIPGIQEIPFYQIGTEQGYLPKVVKVMTGTAVSLPGDGSEPPASCTPATATAPGSNPKDPNCSVALLMAPAERADVIVDFSGLAPGTRVRMVNTGPDVPFYDYAIAPEDLANPAGTGQVMEFRVVAPNAATPADTSTPPASLVLSSEPANKDPVKGIRRAALIEEESQKICVTVDAAGSIAVVGTFPVPQADLATACKALDPAAIPFGPTEVYVGTLVNGIPETQPWSNPITEAPLRGDTELWEIYNYTVDAHPMHLHGARVEVIDREALAFDPGTGAVAIPAALTGEVTAPLAKEAGYKDVVIALPGHVTRIRARFDIAGLYVWHCHIVEHEDNEMMVPVCIKGNAGETACNAAPGGTPWPIVNQGRGLTYGSPLPGRGHPGSGGHQRRPGKGKRS